MIPLTFPVFAAFRQPIVSALFSRTAPDVEGVVPPNDPMTPKIVAHRRALDPRFTALSEDGTVSRPSCS